MRANKLLGKYEIGKEIGEGAFGKYDAIRCCKIKIFRVKYGVNQENNEKVAIKILDKSTLAKNGMIDQIKKEVGDILSLSHN
jgi:serine/threonine protein kinase